MLLVPGLPFETTSAGNVEGTGFSVGQCQGPGVAIEVLGQESSWRVLKRNHLFCIKLYFLCYSDNSWLHKY